MASSLTNTSRPVDNKSVELQAEINRLSEKLGVRPMQVGLRTNDGLNIYIADDGSYHFTFYERGKLGFDRSGSLDDLRYWYCQDVVTSQARKWVGDRAERFKYEYQVLSHLNTDWPRGMSGRLRQCSVMARRRTLPYFRTSANLCNTHSRGIYCCAVSAAWT